jgi:hypothetical protein
MSVVEVLTKTINRIMISRTDNPFSDYRLYCLWDSQEECLLDQWHVRTEDDFSGMKADLMQIYKGGPSDQVS